MLSLEEGLEKSKCITEVLARTGGGGGCVRGFTSFNVCLSLIEKLSVFCSGFAD